MALYYPPVGFHFIVRFSGLGFSVMDVMFQSVSGLSAQVEMESIPEGGENRFTHAVPKGIKFDNLVLTRGIFLESKLVEWCKDAIENFTFKRLDLTIILLSDMHLPLMTWQVTGALPLKWNIDKLDAETSKVVIETIELSYQHFRTITLGDAIGG